MMIILSLLICLFILWTFLMIKGHLKSIDTKVYNKIVFKEAKTLFLKIITSLASTRFFVILSILILLILRNKLAIFLVIFLAGNGIVNEILKRIFKRERPNIKRLVKEKGYSYPSGHTMSATCFYGLLIILTMTSSLLLYIKLAVVLLLVMMIIVIAFSRIYLGVHYFSDVIAGMLGGIIYTSFCVQFMSYVLSSF